MSVPSFYSNHRPYNRVRGAYSTWLTRRQHATRPVYISVQVLRRRTYLFTIVSLLCVDGSVEGISGRHVAGRSRQRQYWSLDDRTGLVGHRARSLDTGNGFTSSTRYHVASAALERTCCTWPLAFDFDFKSPIHLCDSLADGKTVWWPFDGYCYNYLCCLQVHCHYKNKRLG